MLTALLVFLLISNLYLIGAKMIGGIAHPNVFGYSSAIVISGSMSGTIEVNDMVIIHEEDKYSVGDIVSFASNGNLVTHRIVQEFENGFVTKGDANNAEDMDLLVPEQIVGRVVFVIPKIGMFIEYLRTPLGMTCLVFVGFLLIEIPALVRRNKAEETGGESHE